MNDQFCGNCKFYRPAHSTAKDGKCRRRSCRDEIRRFEDDWCGEWAPAGQPKFVQLLVSPETPRYQGILFALDDCGRVWYKDGHGWILEEA